MNSPGNRILLAGFPDEVSNVLKLAFEEAGYAIDVLEAGVSGEHPFDLVIVDTSERPFEEISGLHWMVEGDLPVIELSQQTEGDTRSAPAIALTRPLRISELLALIHDTLSRGA